MKITIIVAKYKEDVSWTEKLPNNIFNVEILDKGPEGTLKNVGREAHSYLHYIVNNYSKLSGTYIFTQGNPFDHCPDFLEKIYTPVSDKLPGGGIRFFGDVIACGPVGEPHHTGLPVKKYWDKIFDRKFPDIIWFVPGAQFIVSASVIKKRPLAFYESLYQMSTEEYFPWVIERLWPEIFAGN